MIDKIRNRSEKAAWYDFITRIRRGHLTFSEALYPSEENYVRKTEYYNKNAIWSDYILSFGYASYVLAIFTEYPYVETFKDIKNQLIRNALRKN